MRRPGRASAATFLAVFFVAALLFAPACAGPEAQPAQSPPPWTGAAGAPATRHELVQAAFDEAVAAVADGSLKGWRAALPVDSLTPDVCLDLDTVFAHLEAVRPRPARVIVEPIPGRELSYSVRFVGGLGRAGPPDRILAERVLRVTPALGLAAAAGDESVAAESSGAVPAIRLSADETPPAVSMLGIMAFRRPRILSVGGVTVVYEKPWRQRAAALAEGARAARGRVAGLYGVGAARPVAVFVYGSRDQVMEALGVAPGVIDARIKYFSHPAVRRAHDLWSPTDIGVIAPALNGSEGWAPVMLQHEVAHAYTLGWFFDRAHAPDFLQEGLAVAAEERHDWSALKQALAHGGLSLPVRDAIALGDIWSGRSTEDVRVLYSAAGAMVDFVLERSGGAALRRWVRGIADGDLSHAEIAAQTERHLGLDWAVFEAGWRDHVERLP